MHIGTKAFRDYVKQGLIDYKPVLDVSVYTDPDYDHGIILGKTKARRQALRSLFYDILPMHPFYGRSYTEADYVYLLDLDSWVVGEKAILSVLEAHGYTLHKNGYYYIPLTAPPSNITLEPTIAKRLLSCRDILGTIARNATIPTLCTLSTVSKHMRAICLEYVPIADRLHKLLQGSAYRANVVMRRIRLDTPIAVWIAMAKVHMPLVLTSLFSARYTLRETKPVVYALYQHKVIGWLEVFAWTFTTDNPSKSVVEKYNTLQAITTDTMALAILERYKLHITRAEAVGELILLLETRYKLGATRRYRHPTVVAVL